MSFAYATGAEFAASFEMVRFAAVTDEHITEALKVAQNHVSQSWLTEDDYQRGQMLYAAHALTLAGLGTGAEAEVSANGMDGFTTIKSGGLSLSRSAQSMDMSQLSSTSYGRRYLEILKRNSLGPRVAVK